MEAFAELVLANLSQVAPQSYPHYATLLDHAFTVASPPYSQEWFGRRYFELARDTEWFANSLVANSALEGYGSTQIWAFSNRMHGDIDVDAVRRHSMDESRHATMFVSIFNLVFPGADIGDAARRRMDEQQPRYSAHRLPPGPRLPEAERMSDADTLDELVGIHLTEIRALVLQLLLAPVLQVYAPAEARSRLKRLSAVLVRDEARHIDYTAAIFDQLAHEGRMDELIDRFEVRTRDFNDLTMVELERERKVAI